MNTTTKTRTARLLAIAVHHYQRGRFERFAKWHKLHVQAAKAERGPLVHAVDVIRAGRPTHPIDIGCPECGAAPGAECVFGPARPARKRSFHPGRVL
jgi:hypothetical protein